jgi:hypothetical protein
MRKNKTNLILSIVVTSIVGTVLIKGAEYMFGVTNVFLFAVAVVTIVGCVIVPAMQINQNRKP